MWPNLHEGSNRIKELRSNIKEVIVNIFRDTKNKTLEQEQNSLLMFRKHLEEHYPIETFWDDRQAL